MTHTQHLKADGNAVASILVFGLPVLGILLLPAFRGFEGVHNKVQLLGGIRHVAAAVPGLEIIKCIFELLALPNQLLQRVRVRLAQHLFARARTFVCARLCVHVCVKYDMSHVTRVCVRVCVIHVPDMSCVPYI